MDTERDLVADARAADLAGAPERALSLYLGALAGEGNTATPQRADVLRWIGNIHLRRGELDDAQARYRQSLQAAESCKYGVGIAQARNCQAVVAQQRGDIEHALEVYRMAAADAATASAHRLVGMIEQNTAVVMSIRGDWDGAMLRYRMSLRAFEEASDEQGMSWVLNNIGTMLRERRQLAEAEASITRARAIADRTGDAWTLAMVEINHAELLLDLGHVGAAEATCGRALAVALARGDTLHEARALKCRARIMGSRNDWRSAVRDLERALGLSRAAADAALTAQLLTELGGARRQVGGSAPAVRRLWEEAIEMYTAAGAGHYAESVKAQLRAFEGSEQAAR